MRHEALQGFTLEFTVLPSDMEGSRPRHATGPLPLVRSIHRHLTALRQWDDITLHVRPYAVAARLDGRLYETSRPLPDGFRAFRLWASRQVLAGTARIGSAGSPDEVRQVYLRDQAPPPVPADFRLRLDRVRGLR